MRSDRLTFALKTGALNLPEAGNILVMRPRGSDDLSALPKARVSIVQGFRPDHDSFAARGFRVTAEVDPGARYTAVLVCLPRAKAEARALISQAVNVLAPGGLIIVDGQKTDGVDSVYRDIRARLNLSEPVSKAHGKLFTFRPGEDRLQDWAAQPQEIEGGFRTCPGVFSADGPDRGSMLLAEALPAKLGARVIDLGAGWGYLSRAVLERPGVKELHLVEADAAALDCARHNVTDARAVFHWADATEFKPDRGVDAVVCNPPFHTSREADPGLGAAFLTAAARMLAPHGTLWLVANRHLPYDRVLTPLFREIEEIGGDASFRLIRAAKPARPNR